jgi:hypothetical protein
LNLGLRYEYVSPLLDILDRRSTFWPLSNSYTTGLPGQVIVAKSAAAKDVLHLDGVGLRSVYAPDKNNWAPRLAVAWDVRNNAKTVVRAAFGLFYDHPLLAVAFNSDIGDAGVRHTH